jgi:hypothetical protein
VHEEGHQAVIVDDDSDAALDAADLAADELSRTWATSTFSRPPELLR